MIGSCVIPEGLWRQMQEASFVLIEREKKARIQRLCDDYRLASTEQIETALRSICKRLGQRKYTDALLALREERREDIVDIVLTYYDHKYDKSMQKRQRIPLKQWDISNIPLTEFASELLRAAVLED